LKVLDGIELDNYRLCMELIFRVFESPVNLGMFITYIISGFVYDCLTINNGYLINDSIYSLKEFGVTNHMMLNFGRYDTYIWSDDFTFLMMNKSLDEFRFRKYKEQLANWYILCNSRGVKRNMLIQVDTFLEFFKDMILQYMMMHKDLDLFFFFLEKDLKKKE
jgi:hypothetical protein